MTQPTKTEAIKAFLTAYTHKDLADLYNHDMEVQITVSKGKGERTTGEYKGKQWQAYTDGFQIWKPIRIPVNANTTPEYTDGPMQYDLKDHAEGIGMTGWDWKNLQSRWVAFDFDAITGHSEKHTKKLNDSELDQIRQAVANIPYVTLRKSTGGKGLHIYVFLKPIHTDNHNEHAAVARAILSQLSGMAGFDFTSKVDIAGGNMWVWHRKMADTKNEGLSLLKISTELATVPANWRDYTKVVSGHRTKNLPRFIENQADIHMGIEDVFNELTGQRLRQPIDAEHKAVMNWLTENYPSAVWWDAEHHMLVTHTALLKECHSALGLRGKFETNAAGAEKGHDHNCFMFPISRGGWSVRRYSLGVQEHAYWQQDGSGWTSCFFNREPTLDQASNLFEGIEDTDGSYWFPNCDLAQQAAALLGADLALPPWAMALKCQLKLHKSGRLVAIIEKNQDSPHLAGWLAKGKKLSKMFSIKHNPNGNETEVLRLDDQVRHLVSEGLDDCGWALKAETDWHNEPIAHIKLYLQSIGYDPRQLANVLGASVSQCWRLVNLPFREEYPGKRQWNRRAAQLRIKPSLNRDSLNYDSWTKILNHCGKNLDETVKNNEWCKQHGVLTGADWLKCWIASMFQEPLEPLPYIFFYGPQNSGKSIFHEALELLVSRGVCRADQALVSGGGFNGELEGKVLCVIEEVDLKKNVSAYNRIKDWVTSKMLPIHRKMEQPYLTPNSTHWLQCANTHLFCPVFPGDTRITMIFVDSLAPKELIPKKELLAQLEREAPDFLAEILSVELPPSGDRLNIPCLQTEDKATAEYANQTMLETFCAEKCHYSPGHRVKFSEFCERYHEWLDPNTVGSWTKIRIGKELPPKFVKARLPQTGEFWIGNMSLTPVAEKDYGAKFFSREGKLYQEIPKMVVDIPIIPQEPMQGVVIDSGPDQRDISSGSSNPANPELPPPV